MSYIIQGDHYFLCIGLKYNNKLTVLPQEVEEIQFLVNNIDKRFINTEYIGEWGNGGRYEISSDNIYPVVYYNKKYYKLKENILVSTVAPPNDNVHWNEFNDVMFDSINNVYLYPISQTETFAFNGGIKCQARIKLKNGEVYGTKIKITDVFGTNTIVKL